MGYKVLDRRKKKELAQVGKQNSASLEETKTPIPFARRKAKGEETGI